MNAQRGPETLGIIPAITGDQARRLLRVGVSGPKHVVDRLMERLEMEDGQNWLDQALRAEPMRLAGDPVNAFVRGKATLEQLDRIKDASKVFASKAGVGPTPAGSGGKSAKTGGKGAANGAAGGAGGAGAGGGGAGGGVPQGVRDEDSALSGILGYFLAVAAALTHHGKLISSRPRRDVDPILLDLAAVLPEPWADLMCRATLRDGPLAP